MKLKLLFAIAATPALLGGQENEAVFGIRLEVEESNSPGESSIYLTLGDESAYTDAAGWPTSEGYSLTTNGSGIFITGASSLVVWWGTWTVLQQAALREDDPGLPYGSANDMLGWGERGMMLDAARNYYPRTFLIEMCSYMSFFKQNIFHLHLSDNLFNSKNYSREQSLGLDAWFRFGLTMKI
ncbi:glycosyl hydrolase family protein [Hirsutella rhossiliensis]|uniref:beta-N-acetylhexosaminidase n=1 Tax=Hirsutella rhossiliensis TaxID=111463 RepID=A0A9P8N7X4_9HYPO|nr:glycosyl hydrolase family protein [Hirsutella rhossiliensis]KAH0967379.1 glycosyl hydrolase family protein [Hirsutella rhossiliensis]